MVEIVDWARNLLTSRGALVEEEAGVLRAMLSPELARDLDAGEWLSLRFGAGASSDDESEWLERFGRLLPPDARVTGARLRHPRLVPPVDSVRLLDRDLAIQNGIYRLPEDYQALARYYFFSFQYTMESDETSLGVWTVCLNASARSLVNQPESMLKAVADDLEEEPGFVRDRLAIDREELKQLFPIALRSAQPEIRRFAQGMELNANRRMARDSERINGYYRDLLRQIDKRIARHEGDAQAVEKERSRAAATQLDRTAKLADLARRYSVKIRIEPGDVLAVSLPVREISARVIRKKAERAAKFHWNPAAGGLESPWCESCSGRAHPVFLCDDRVHFLCKACLAPCASCGRQFCRACQRKCKCGAAA
jgi:hypothetical protein